MAVGGCFGFVGFFAPYRRPSTKTPQMLPTEAELGRHCTVELSEQGGHVGFVGPGGVPWLDGRVVAVVRGMLGV